MNRFKEIISKVGGEDKVLHFETCCLIVLFVCLACMKLGMGQGHAVWCSWVLTLVIGILKEVNDAKHGEYFDGEDIKADALGAFAGVLIIVIFG